MEQITRGVPSFFPVVSGVLIKSNPVPIVSFRIYGENCPCLMSSIILLLVGLIPAFCMLLKHMKSIEIVFFFWGSIDSQCFLWWFPCLSNVACYVPNFQFPSGGLCRQRWRWEIPPPTLYHGNVLATGWICPMRRAGGKTETKKMWEPLVSTGTWFTG